MQVFLELVLRTFVLLKIFSRLSGPVVSNKINIQRHSCLREWEYAPFALQYDSQMMFEKEVLYHHLFVRQKPCLQKRQLIHPMVRFSQELLKKFFRVNDV